MRFVSVTGRVAMLLLALLGALAGCHHEKTVAVSPPVVEVVPPPKCDLPALPDPIEPQVVGFPTPEEILVSKSDIADIIGYVTALNDWIRAANACLQAAQR